MSDNNTPKQDVLQTVLISRTGSIWHVNYVYTDYSLGCTATAGHVFRSFAEVLEYLKTTQGVD
jgi:hypothetical protein